MLPFDNIEGFENVSPAIQWAIVIVGGLLILVALFAVIVEIVLFFKYIKYNRTMNSAGINGEEVARRMLDENGLQHIKVSVKGSFLFGNSYSHYFKKIRLRRRTIKKNSISSLAMGAQKVGLAVLDKEGDKDMKTRIALTPLIYFGPIAFIPLIAVGVIADIIFFNFSGVVSIISVAASLAFYLLSFILSIMVLKTEVKAQKRCLELLKQENLANDQEIEMMKSLFKLYNIEYINDIIIELLQMILRILEIVAKIQASSSSSSNS